MEDAVAAYGADIFWSAFEIGYQRLVADSEQWAGIQAERVDEAPALADQSNGP